ncbi:MAG TPA: hypothetical protein VIP98_16375 [Microlunatus sp.]
MTSAEPIDLCCLLWARPGQEAALSAYEDEVLDLVAGHGGAVISRGVGDGKDGRPLEVQFFRFPAQAALDGYLADPRRTALSEVRDRVIARTELFPVGLR